jgi:hypothetical protein
MYKVNHFNNGKFFFAEYFESKKEAIEVRDEYNAKFGAKGFRAKLQTKRVSLVFHHSALERGYIGKKNGYNEYYKGLYGVGIKKHIPNCERAHTSNTYYHYIEYYLECP